MQDRAHVGRERIVWIWSHVNYSFDCTKSLD
jgi:hypothetical protein